MKKIFYILFLMFIFAGCTNKSIPLEEKINIDNKEINYLKDININDSEIITKDLDLDVIEKTSEKDIEELIDILFETNN